MSLIYYSALIFIDLIFNVLLFSETYTIFSGGLSMEKGGKSPCITVLQGKTTTVLEMEHPVIDFVTICESPWVAGENLFIIDFLHEVFLLYYIFLNFQTCKNHMQ